MKFLKQIGWVIAFAIVGLLYLTFDKQSLDELGGYAEIKSGEKVPVRNLRKVIMSAIDHEKNLILSEKEINLYLSQSMKLTQGGFLSEYLEVKGLWIQLHDGEAELILEREFFNRIQTTSMTMEVKEEGGIGRYISYPGGRLGKVTVLSGHLLLVMDGFEKVAKRYETNLQLITKRFDSFHFKEGELHLISNAKQVNE